MIAQVGSFSLCVALALALIQAVVPLLGAQLRIPEWMGVAKPAARGQLLFVALAFATLTYGFLNDDFSLSYVAQNSNSALPVSYKIAAVWGAHEGSLLLWTLVLGLWTLAVTIFSRSLLPEYLARVIAVMGWISVGFLLFMLTTSNPFEQLFPVPADGRDLNPLLQDPGLVIHPPMLYMGYVGFSVAFAFAIAALLEGRLDAAWARWSRPWVLSAWLFLTCGITLGSWWAYNELGWGGWWFWDPVENASFMPWLVGTALIHSLVVTEKRGVFKSWTVLLAILAFALSLVGTFLVRSGVLVSVHAFASDPARGLFILIFLSLVIGGSLVLYALRASKVKGGPGYALLSRENALLLNNILLIVALAVILLGTLAPLAMDTLGIAKISVGPPYFSSMFVPLMLPLVLLLGLGPVIRWKQGSGQDLWRRLQVPAIAAVLLGVVLPFLFMGRSSLLMMGGLTAGLWAVLSPVQLFMRQLRAQAGTRSLKAAAAGLSGGFWGMSLAHLGVGIFVIGVSAASAFSAEKDAVLGEGQSADLAGFSFRLTDSHLEDGPNYTADHASVEVSRKGRIVAVLHPEKRIYRVQTSPMTEAGIDVGVFRDLYVSLGEPIDEGRRWGVRIYYKPFVRWIWAGALLMALGGLVAAADRRYRIMREQPSSGLVHPVTPTV